jgi:phosphate transport system permease protein
MSASRLRRRYAAERRFRLYGAGAIAIAVAILAALLGSILWQGVGALWRTEILLDVEIDAGIVDPAGGRDPAVLAGADYGLVVKNALRADFPDVTERKEKRDLGALLSSEAAHILRAQVLADPDLIGTRLRLWVPASSDVDMLMKGVLDRDSLARALAGDGRLNADQVAWVGVLDAEGRIAKGFNAAFFTRGDSREPEQAGIGGALVGTILTMLVTFVLSFPLGVAAAIYLEEFAPKNRWTDLIEVNINNLAAVPSIVFGLLGLAVFLGFFGLPRSAPLVGGMVLSLMTLPTLIIAARAAVAAVPPSIRDGALALGASPLQTVLHHVLPLAMPGILTGSIIGMARAAGETAPLLMIGMVAFIVDIPGGIGDPSSVLPVQVFLWADAPERGFAEKTAAAILVLLVFLALVNLVAVVLRRRFERRW